MNFIFNNSFVKIKYHKLKNLLEILEAFKYEEDGGDLNSYFEGYLNTDAFFAAKWDLKNSLEAHEESKANEDLREEQPDETDESEIQWADHYHKKLVEAREKGYLPEDFSF